MFCTNCGSRIGNNYSFCPKCGERQNNNENINSVNINNFNGSVAMSGYSEYSVSKLNYLEIFKTFFIGMGFVALGSIFALYFLPYSLIRIINILFIIFMAASAFILKENIFKTKVSMNIYCFIMGIILSITLFYYLGTLGSGIFMSCVLGVGLIFGVAYFYASKSSEEDIFSMSPVIYKCMVALLIFEILNIFLFKFGMFDMILSTAAILIYSTYTLYTIKKIQVECSTRILDEESIVILSLSLVTSFLNLLLHLLRIIAASKRNN